MQASLVESESMTLPKKEVLDLVRRMPAKVDIEELIYRLYLREKLERAEQDIAAGRTYSAEEVRRRVRRWRK